MRVFLFALWLTASGWASAQNITDYEYWFNTNDANRTLVDVADAQTSNLPNESIVLGTLPVGYHKIHYRLKDSNGRWSSVISKPFSVLPGGPYELVLLRYWSDQEADTANISDLTTVPITPNVQYLDIIDDVLFCNWSTTGQTDVYFQLKDNHEQWSSVITRNYNVVGSTSLVGAPTFVSPNLNPPFGESLTYTVTAVPGAAGYEWTLPDGWTGSSTTNSINVQVGNENNAWQLCVRAYNGCGFGEQTCLDITTAVEQLVQQGGISLFPNPTTGQVRVLCDKSQPIIRLMVLSPTGQVVRDAQPAQSERYTLDLSNEASGLYTVRVMQGNETTQLRVMVQH